MSSVLIADPVSPRAVEIFRDRGIKAEVKTGLKPDQLIAAIDGFDGLVVRSTTRVTAAVLAAGKALKVVGRAGIGVDNVDVPAATARGVVVMNTPFGNAVTTAEHAIAMMFALARQLPAADRSTQAGKWEKARFMGVELTGKTLGIIGCGNIGGIVADRALGLKMRVIASDPYLSPERARALGVEKVELDALLARADFITLHTPLTDSTRHIIDKAALAKTRRGVRIINCARGELVVEEDLKEALQSRHVAGAALDVFAVEPATASSLFGRDDVIATPHLGASTTEAQEKVALQVAEQMSDFLLTGAVTNAVNAPSVSAEDAPKLRPYFRLAEQLGSFIGQLLETAPISVTVEFEGHVASLNTKPLTATAVAALLAPQLTSVNAVSAPMVARDRGIDLVEVRHERPSDYLSLIGVTAITERRTRHISGTLFGGSRPRVVEIEGINIEAELGPFMLYLRNHDKPGLIGALGTVLGDAGVNIATFHLGRAAPGAEAICLIEIDQKLTDPIIDAVRGISQVVTAKALRF